MVSVPKRTLRRRCVLRCFQSLLRNLNTQMFTNGSLDRMRVLSNCFFNSFTDFHSCDVVSSSIMRKNEALSFDRFAPLCCFETLNLLHVSSRKMFTFRDVCHETKQKTQTNFWKDFNEHSFSLMKSQARKSGNLNQNMALLFKIILTEYFYAKLLENAHYGLKLISNLRVYFTNGWRW